MTQEERWKARYDEVKTFIDMYNYIKHTRKQMNQGLLKENRIEMFKRLLGLMEQYKRVNQYL